MLNIENELSKTEFVNKELMNWHC